MSVDDVVSRERGSAVEPRWSSVPADLDKELVRRLFVAQERWGWQYVAPADLAPFPADAPQWQEPAPLDTRGYEHAIVVAQKKLPARIGWGIPLVLLGLATLFSGTAVGGLFGLLGIGGGGALIAVALNGVNTARRNLDAAKAYAHAERERSHGRFQAATQTWGQDKARHDHAERTRFDSVLLHHPLVFGGTPSRVDVVGGTPAGWASLLATMGSSALASGSTVLMLDLSGHDVGSGLTRLAHEHGAPVRTATVPRHLEDLGFLRDLEPRDLAEVLAEALGATQAQAENTDLRANLLHTVARRLDRPLTFARLGAGVEVLRSGYDLDGDGPLGNREVARLTKHVDDLDKGERARDELRFLSDQLEVLATSTQGDDDREPAELDLFGAGLTVLRNEARQPRRKALVDRVLFQLVLHHLADQPPGATHPMLVVAGADQLGRANLESMVRHAWAARVRLVYLFEHLREDSESLLGGSDSAALIMRLGNAREAAAATDFVGKVHGLKLSQLSRQVGRTLTDGGSTSTGGTEGASHTRGSSTNTDAWGWVTGGSSNSSFTENWSKSWQEAKNWSESSSQNDSATLQRSYDLIVEPTVIQGLDPTAFVLVDSRGGERRVVAGDCFPGMVLVPRVSERPMLT